MLRTSFHSVCLSLLLVGCLEESNTDEEALPSDTLAGNKTARPDAGTSPSTKPPRENAEPNARDEAPPTQTDDETDAGTSRADEPSKTGSKGLPCDVAAVVAKHCSRCHGDEPQAPMPLMTYEDFNAPSLRDAAQPYYARTRTRIHDLSNPMPPIGRPVLTKDELAILDGWIDSGAPRSDQGCDVEPPPVEVKPEFDWTQCDYDVEMRAHSGQSADDEEPFAVPEEDDYYECFNFELPWTAVVHGLYLDPLIDDARVVHHWSLTTVSKKLEAGSHYHGECGKEGHSAPVAGWTPGSPATSVPDHVGIKIMDGTNATFQLEIHYNNAARLKNVRDRSGVRVCATDKLRPDEAVPVTLGSPCFGPLCTGLPPGKSEVSNTCISTSLVGPAHVLWTAPHMHKLGRHLTSEVTRPDGTSYMLTDAPFDFRNQERYPSDALIYPGDRIRTTCTFENDTTKTVQVGENTSDEMCFNFLLVWPANSFGALLPGDYCITPLP